MKNQKSNIKNQNCGVPASGHDLLFTFCLLSSVFCVLHLAGCVSDKANSRSVNPAVRSYQRTLAEKGPQQRADTQASGAAEPLGILKPVASDTDVLKPVEIVADPNTGRSRVALTIEEAIARTLANSPEIRVVSFDPSIAEQDITRAASEFDVTAFGRLNFEQEDNPSNSIFSRDSRTTARWNRESNRRASPGPNGR